MNPIRCLLVDDERLARKLLRELLAAHPRFTVIGEAANIRQAEELVRRERPDVLFLDIQMAGGNGFELLRNLIPDLPYVVFVTAHDQYALRAFEINALDYLLKPIEPERLAIALRRLEQLIAHHVPAVPPDSKLSRMRADDHVLIQAGRSGFFVRPNEILTIIAEGNYTVVQLADGKRVVVRQSLTQWAERLPVAGFLVLDRSCLVNLQRICKSYLTAQGAKVHFDAPAPALELGRAATQRLKQALATQ